MPADRRSPPSAFPSTDLMDPRGQQATAHRMQQVARRPPNQASHGHCQFGATARQHHVAILAPTLASTVATNQLLACPRTVAFAFVELSDAGTSTMPSRFDPGNYEVGLGATRVVSGHYGKGSHTATASRRNVLAERSKIASSTRTLRLHAMRFLNPDKEHDIAYVLSCVAF